MTTFPISSSNAIPMHPAMPAPSWLEKKAYRFSQSLLTMKERSISTLERSKAAHPNPSILRKGLFGAWRWVSKNILDLDYVELAKLKIGKTNFGHILSEPPMGALFFLLFGFMLVSRTVMALSRAQKISDQTGEKIKVDWREVRDIWIRDPLTTFPVILYCIDPVRRSLCRFFEKPVRSFFGLKSYGLKLTSDSGYFKYEQLRNIYTISSAAKLQKIVETNVNHVKGLEAALEVALNNLKKQNRHYRSANSMAEQLAVFRKELRALHHAIYTGQNPQHIQAFAEKAYDTLHKAEKIRVETLEGLASHMSPLLKKQNLSQFVKRLPTFKELFTRYSMSRYVWADLPAYLIIIGVLGYLIPKVNEWLTIWEYGRKYAADQKTKNPSATHRLVNPTPVFVDPRTLFTQPVGNVPQFSAFQHR